MWGGVLLGAHSHKLAGTRMEHVCWTKGLHGHEHITWGAFPCRLFMWEHVAYTVSPLNHVLQGFCMLRKWCWNITVAQQYWEYDIGMNLGSLTTRELEYKSRNHEPSWTLVDWPLSSHFPESDKATEGQRSGVRETVTNANVDVRSWRQERQVLAWCFKVAAASRSRPNSANKQKVKCKVAWADALRGRFAL